MIFEAVLVLVASLDAVLQDGNANVGSDFGALFLNPIKYIIGS
jgi:hypothetical protein